MDDLFGDLPLPKNEIEKERNSSGSKSETSNSNESDSKKRCAESDDSESSNNKKLCTDIELLKLKAYAAERKGERDEMQDKHVIIENFIPFAKEASPEIKRLSYYAVFDGHAGIRAAEHCASRLHIVLGEKFPKGNMEKVEKEIKKCFIDTFKAVDDEFLKIASSNKPAWKDGTTATVGLVINNVLYVANVGDSRAIICRKNEENVFLPIVLSKDHNPSIYEERQRIQKAGGNVRDGRILNVLEVSRSIGDGQFKAYGVSCVPDVRKCQLTKAHLFIVIACDGFWKSFENQETCEFISPFISKAYDLSKDNENIKDSTLDSCCNKLASEAVKRLSGDNVTVIFASIK